MSFEHKAFIFDYTSFCKELKYDLVQALSSDDLSALFLFIENNRSVMTDPYEGAPLDSGWRKLIEDEDSHQLGDFAITKYYDPKSDVGLGSDWERVQSALDEKFTPGEITVLGHTIGPERNYFDPGKMGSYFLSAEEVKEMLGKLDNLPDNELTAVVCQFLDVLRQCEERNNGLYVTF